MTPKVGEGESLGVGRVGSTLIELTSLPHHTFGDQVEKGEKQQNV